MRWLLLSLLLLGACRPSTRFALPAPQGSPQKVEFVWKEEAQPIMARGDQWDAVDTLNPSVVKWRGLYWNLYSGFDGKTWHTGTATSSDGMQWNHRRKVLSPDPAGWEGRYIAANGTALVDGDAVLYWYQAGAGAPAIGLARSRDGVAWQKEPRAVLDPGPRGSWDERGVADPYVIKSGEWFYLYYGSGSAWRDRAMASRGRSRSTTRSSTSVATKRGTKADSANRPSGPATDPIGCFTPAAPGMKSDALEWQSRKMASIGKSCR